jgi:tight adherence protein C
MPRSILALIAVAPFFTIAAVLLWHEFQVEVVTSVGGLRLAAATKKSRREIEQEFPMVVELFAILLGANLSPAVALLRISQRSNGAFAEVLQEAVSDIRHGANFSQALELLSTRVASPMVRRFCDSLMIAVERGSPLLEVVNRQVAEVRQEQKVALIEAAGKAEIGLMIPVVFLILPISVLFALWPSYFSLGRAVGL